MEWRTIPGYPGYEVSNTGDVRRAGRILKPWLTRGYKTVRLGFIADNRKNQYIAILVAQAFLPNPDNLPTVDHIDRNPLNNHVSNLRWASRHTQMMNQHRPTGASGHRHIYKIGNGWMVQIKRHKQIVFVEYFPTIDEAIKARDEWLMTADPGFH